MLSNVCNVCMYVCMVCMHVCMHACMHVCTYVCMVCMVCMVCTVCMYVCMHACMYVNIYAYISIYYKDRVGIVASKPPQPGIRHDLWQRDLLDKLFGGGWP